MTTLMLSGAGPNTATPGKSRLREWAHCMKATSIIWRRTFPECEPGTDGVALFEGRVIGRVRLMTELPHDPKPWLWSRLRPGSRRSAGLDQHVRRNDHAPAGHGPPDRALAGAAPRQRRS
jgi:hypothetical protein